MHQFSKSWKEEREAAEAMEREIASPKPAVKSTPKPVVQSITVHSTFAHTTDYSIFKVITSNREVNKKHVNKLAEAIKNKNLLHLNPIVVNGNMEVIDGQHRLEAAKLLQIPVYYVQDSGIGRNDIATMNSNKKLWSIMDYVNFFAIEGKPDYIQFNKLCNKYPQFKPSWLQSLCSKNGRRDIGSLKAGRIDVSNISSADIWGGYLMDYSKYIPTVYSTRFIEGAVQFFSANDYNHQTMMKKIHENQDLITPCIEATKYTSMLKKIYNR